MAIEKGFSCNSSILEIEEGGVLIQEGCLFNIMAYGLVLIQGIALIIAWVLIRGNTVFVQGKLQGSKNGTFFLVLTQIAQARKWASVNILKILRYAMGEI